MISRLDLQYRDCMELRILNECEMQMVQAVMIARGGR